MVGVSESTEATAVAGESTDQGSEEFKAPASQEELDRIIAARLDRERKKFADYNDVKARAAKLDELEEASKSETQKLQEQLAALKEQATRSEHDRARLAAIASAGIPEEFQDLVHGSDPESLNASALKVKALMASTAPQQNEASFVIPSEGNSPSLALNSDGIESALRKALGIA